MRWLLTGLLLLTSVAAVAADTATTVVFTGVIVADVKTGKVVPYWSSRWSQ